MKVPELCGRRLERRKENEFVFAGRGQGGGKGKGRSSKKKSSMQVQLQDEIKAIQRLRPGDEEGPPVRDVEQAIAQVDGTVQNNRSTRKRRLPPRDTGRRGDSSHLERHPSQVLLQLKHCK